MEEPKVEYVVVPVDLRAIHKELYNDLKKTFIAELNEHERVTARHTAGVRIMRFTQLDCAELSYLLIVATLTKKEVSPSQ